MNVMDHKNKDMGGGMMDDKYTWNTTAFAAQAGLVIKHQKPLSALKSITQLPFGWDN